jgi:hypothetical protein
MPLSRWATSVFITCHVAAVATGALGTREWGLPVQLAAAYLRATGLRQEWTMFATPAAFDQYVRVRYFIESGAAGDGRFWAATELVMPAHREDRVRLLQSFRDSYRDKAIASALQEFVRRPGHDTATPDTRPQTISDDLAPVARFFAAQFGRQYLGSGERIVRTEVWVGTAAIPARPAMQPSGRLERQAALLAYYEGPSEHRLRVPPYALYHAADDEADIRWVLEYFEGE